MSFHQSTRVTLGIGAPQGKVKEIRDSRRRPFWCSLMSRSVHSLAPHRHCRRAKTRTDESGRLRDDSGKVAAAAGRLSSWRRYVECRARRDLPVEGATSATAGRPTDEIVEPHMLPRLLCACRLPLKNVTPAGIGIQCPVQDEGLRWPSCGERRSFFRWANRVVPMSGT